MRRQKQLQFQTDEFNIPKASFGGSLLKGNPKKARPLESKLPIHLVLRAEQTKMRAPKVFGSVNKTVLNTCKKHGVTIYRFANVGSHLHLLIKIPGRRKWAAFIRELTGRVAQVAQQITARQPGLAQFWKHRPFTRIVKSWRKPFQIAKQYIELNVLEAEGYIRRKETKTLKDLRLIWADS